MVLWHKGRKYRKKKHRVMRNRQQTRYQMRNLPQIQAVRKRIKRRKKIKESIRKIRIK